MRKRDGPRRYKASNEDLGVRRSRFYSRMRSHLVRVVFLDDQPWELKAGCWY